MADETKTAAKPRTARRTAAKTAKTGATARAPAPSKTKTADTGAPAPRARTATAEAPKAENTATIKIAKVPGVRRDHIDVVANGRRYKIPTGQEVEVNEAAYNALKDSRYDFETISPLTGAGAGEGSSASDSSTVGGTAIRAIAPGEDDGQGSTAPLTEEPHELSQGGPGTDQKSPADETAEANAQRNAGS